MNHFKEAFVFWNCSTSASSLLCVMGLWAPGEEGRPLGTRSWKKTSLLLSVVCVVWSWSKLLIPWGVDGMNFL